MDLSCSFDATKVEPTLCEPTLNDTDTCKGPDGGEVDLAFARAACSEGNLSSFYIESCIYDFCTTGDPDTPDQYEMIPPPNTTVPVVLPDPPSPPPVGCGSGGAALPPPPLLPPPPAPPPVDTSECSCTTPPTPEDPDGTCSATGDPHYYNFLGEKFDYFARGLYEHARFRINKCGCEVVMQVLNAKLVRGKVCARTACLGVSGAWAGRVEQGHERKYLCALLPRWHRGRGCSSRAHP